MRLPWISPVVLKGFSYINPKEIVYRIKLINYSNRQVVELNAEAWIVEKRNNRWTPVTKLKLEYDGELPALGRHKDYGDVSLGISPIFCMNIKEENLESKVNEENRKLNFTLSAKDALSGTAVVHRQIYSRKNIQEGDFELGFEFKTRAPCCAI